jgi:sec-independent protein translocase protein TatA
MRSPQGFEWLLILFIVLLLFGSKRLPDMARSLGRSARILKAETKGLAEDDDAPAPVAGVEKASGIEQVEPGASEQPQRQHLDKPTL